MQEKKSGIPYYQRNLVVLSTTVLLSSISWSQLFPFLPLFLKELGVTGAKENLQWSGLVVAAQSIASIVTLPFWGKMGDKYGRKPMTIRAGVCLAGIYYGMSFCTAPWQLVMYRFLNGALTGFIPGSVALIATNSPQSKAPRHVAIVQTAAAIGAIVGPAVGGVLAAIWGYRGSMRISGTAVIICTLLVWALVQERNKAKPAEKTSLLQDFVYSLKSPIMSSVMLAVMLYAVFIPAVVPVLSLHLSRIGRLGPDELKHITGLVLSLPPLDVVLTTYLWTRFGERWGHDRAIYIGTIGAATCALLLVFIKSIWLFAMLFFLSGVFLAAMNPCAGAIVVNHVEESFRGRAYGMLWSATTLGAFVAPLAAAAIGSAFGIPAIFVFIAATLFVGSLGFRILVGKWVGTT